MSAYSDLVLSLSPLLYYRLNETSGTTAVAAAGSNGTYNSMGALGVAGLITDGDLAASFSTTSGSYVRSALTLSSTLDRTIVCWIKSAGQTSGGSAIRPIFVCPTAAGGVDNSAQAVAISAFRSDAPAPATAGSLLFQYGIGTAPTSAHYAVGIDDGLPHMIALRRDGSTIRPYFDGVALATFAIGAVSVGLPCDIGGAPTQSASGTRHFNGVMDEVSVYAGLMAADITGLYNAGIAAIASGGLLMRRRRSAA